MSHEKKSEVKVPLRSLRTLLTITGLIFLSGQARGIENRLRISAKVEIAGSTFKIKGRLESPDFSARSICLYLPYNDPNRHIFKPNVAMYFANQVVFSDQSSHKTTLQALPPFSMTELSSEIVRINNPRGQPLSIDFVSEQQILARSETREALMSGFYPVPAPDCKAPVNQEAYRFQAKVEVPTGWLAAGPGVKTQGGITYFHTLAPSLEIATSTHWQETRFRFQNVQITVLHQGDALKESIESALASHTTILGAFPYKALTIWFAENVPPGTTPGLITINRPKQVLFDKLQKRYLNWKHWVISSLIAAQWYGTAITSSVDDEWLLQGIVDFATMNSLVSFPKRQNLLNSFDSNFAPLVFSYLQMQEFFATYLVRSRPHSRLTDADFVTKDLKAHQSPYLFVKHALALRQLDRLYGGAVFRTWLLSFTRRTLFQNISPKVFMSALESISGTTGTVRTELSQNLADWWTRPGWPDFVLRDFKKTQLGKDQWLAEVQVGQSGDFAPPARVAILGANGETEFVSAHPTLARSDTSYVITNFEPHDVTIDPQHEVYDSNRFNNSDHFPTMQFFPGTADTFSDSSYTAVWLPYIFRRPGESTSLALQSAIFRYLHNQLFIHGETQPGHDLTGYNLRVKSETPIRSVTSNLSIYKDYQNSRTAEVKLTHQQPLIDPVSAGIGVYGRRREIVGLAHTKHYTLGANFKTSLIPIGGCGTVFSADSEHAPQTEDKLFAYDRQKGGLSLTCSIPGAIRFNSNAFVAKFSHSGTPPSSAFFRPNDGDEAGLRIDVAGLPSSDRIQGITNDLLLPFALPLPRDSFVISDRLRLALFYDYARAGREALTEEYRAGGFGFLFPLGGDIVGVGSLSLLKLSLYCALYTKAGEQVSHSPKVMFNFSGEL